MDKIDLRSDTVTWPTPRMRRAMANASVGDDVYGEDPTVNKLQEMAARRMGMEAGLFVASGTMGNLVAILTHCGRGDEMIIGDISHTFLHEVGSASALGGVHPHTVPVRDDGTIARDDIRAAIRNPSDLHYPPTRLICLENTQGATGGMPLSAEYTRSVVELAREHGLKVHVDGARIFNAAVALGCEAKELVAGVDSVSFCLSKGLCAPVGSVLCGSAEFIERARKIRKMLGGGMRQVGILAAAGIVALEEMTGRLAEDHRRAKMLAEGLATVPGLIVEPERVKTNMVMFSLADDVSLDAYQVAKRLRAYDVLVGPRTERSFRAVTHYWIDDERVEKAVEAFRKVLQ